MRSSADKRIASWLKRIWERTGVLPLLRWPRSPDVVAWWRRNIGPLPAQGAVSVLGDRLRAALATHGLVMVPVGLEVYHRSGVALQACKMYATGLLEMGRARELAAQLREQGAVLVPYGADTAPFLVDAHLRRRKMFDGEPEPEVFTLTDNARERMRLMNAIPVAMTRGQIQREEPVPEGVRLFDPRRAMEPMESEYERRRETPPAYRPAAVF